MHCNTAYLLDSLNKSTNKPNFQPSNSFPSHHPFIGSNCSWSCSSAPAKPKLSATIISQTSNCKFSNSLENIPAFKKGQVGEATIQLENSSVEISKPKARFPSIIQRKKVLRTEIKKEYLDSIGSIKQCKKGDRIRKVAKNQMCSSTNKMIAISYPSTNRVKPIGRITNDGSRNFHPCSTPDAANFAQKFSKNALFGGELSSYYKPQDFQKSESMFLESGETGPASERLRQMAARYQNQSISDGFYSEYGEVRSMEALNSSNNFNYQMPFISNNELQESKNSCPPSHPDDTIFAPHLETKQFPQNTAYPPPTSSEIATQPLVKASSPVCSTNHSKVPPFQNFHIRSYYHHQQQPTGDYASNNKNDNYADPGSYATRTTACTRIVDMNCNLSTSDARAIENGNANVGHCYNDFTTEHHSRKLNDEVYSPWSTNNFYYHCNLNQGWPDLPGYYVEKEKLPTGNNSSRSLKSAPDVGYSAEEQEFAANNFSSSGSSLCLAQHPPGSQKFHLGEISDPTTNSYAQNDPSWPAPQPFSFWHHQTTQYTLPSSQVGYTSDEFSQTLQQQSDVLISSLPEICNKNETKPPPPYLSPKSKRKVCAVVNPSVVSRPDKNDHTFSDDKNEMDPIKPLQAFDETNKQVSIELSKTSGIDEAACIGLATTSISFGSDCFQDSFASSIYQHKLSTT